MSDVRIRELERRFNESGLAVDEAAWLSERVRLGMLDRARVELAAYLGHEPSQLALGRAPHAPEPHEYWGLIDYLPTHGVEAFTRATLAVARLFVDSQQPPLDNRVYRALESVEDWLTDPSQEHRERAIRAGEAVELLVYEDPPRADEIAAWFASQPSAGVEQWDSGTPDTNFFRTEGVSGFEARDLLKLASLNEVVPWALGYSDSVQERVEARHQAGADQ